MHINNKRTFRGVFFSFLIIFMFFLSSCSTYESFKSVFISKDSEPEATVRIGVFEPMSGKAKAMGELEIIGIKLAHEKFPKALGKDVELVMGDNKSDMYVAESVAKDLVDKRVSVVLGSYGSDNSLMAVKTFEEAKIPAISITNTNPLVTSYNPYYFRVCLLDSFQGVALAKYAAQILNLKTAAIFRPKMDDYSMAVSQTFSEKFTHITGDPASLLLSVDFDPDQDDFSKALKKIKKSGAEVVFLPAEPNISSKIIVQAREFGLTALFLGTDQWDNEEFLNSLGSLKLENISFSTVFDPDTSTTFMSESFIKAYKAKYGENSIPDSAIALGFDAYMIAVDSLNKTGSSLNGEALRNTIAHTKEFPGASGSITLDQNGDPIKSVVIKSVINGKAESHHTVEPQIVNLYELSLQKSTEAGSQN